MHNVHLVLYFILFFYQIDKLFDVITAATINMYVFHFKFYY